MRVVLLLLYVCIVVQGTLPVYNLDEWSKTDTGYAGKAHITSGSGPYGSDVANIGIQAVFVSADILRVRIFDAGAARWEVPGVIQPFTPVGPSASVHYRLATSSSPFGFSVVRTTDEALLFNSTTSSPTIDLPNLIFEDQYISFGTSLPLDPNIYGLGERVHNLRLNNGGNTYTIYSCDQANEENVNLYGHHPFYLDFRQGKAHGVFLLNSNAMDVKIFHDALSYRLIGGIVDLFFLMGPTSEDVIRQYHSLIGRPYMIPMWSLGWHQCRWGYKTLSEVKNVVASYAANGIPLDTMWADIDHMNGYRIFTTDPTNFPEAEFKEFVETLHAKGQQFVVIEDPGVKYEAGYPVYDDLIRAGAYIRDPTNTKPLVNKVWPGYTIFPDFTNPNVSSYWTGEVDAFLKKLPVDGLWIDMNEVASFCDGSCYPTGQAIPPKTFGFDPDHPPYVPGGRDLNKHTVALSARVFSTLQYNTHDMYGYLEGVATADALKAVTKKRPFVLSRSTFAGHGHHAAHWLGDNDSTFRSMALSIPGMLNFQFFGVPLVGADICGFNGDTTAELCTRWMELGSFYPFARNHNSIGRKSQEPYVFGPDLIAISKRVLKNRLALSPYYYTLMFDAHMQGGTVLRPLFFEFPMEYLANVHFVDQQFLIGSWLLVSPVLEDGARTVKAYFPQATWFDYWTGEALAGSGWKVLNAPLDTIHVHIRGGGIVPRLAPGMTIAESRKNPFDILVAFSADGNANGRLFVDDGISLDNIDRGEYELLSFRARLSGGKGSLMSSVDHDGYSPAKGMKIDSLTAMGVSLSKVCYVKCNGVDIKTFTFDATKRLLTATGLSAVLSQPLSLTFGCDA